MQTWDPFCSTGQPLSVAEHCVPRTDQLEDSHCYWSIVKIASGNNLDRCCINWVGQCTANELKSLSRKGEWYKTRFWHRIENFVSLNNNLETNITARNKIRFDFSFQPTLAHGLIKRISQNQAQALFTEGWLMIVLSGMHFISKIRVHLRWYYCPNSEWYFRGTASVDCSMQTENNARNYSYEVILPS